MSCVQSQRFWFFFFFAKRWTRVATRVHLFAALSQLSRQGRSQDFSVGTHSFPSHLSTPHPPPKKRSKSFSIHVSFISNRVRKSLNWIQINLFFCLLFLWVSRFRYAIAYLRTGSYAPARAEENPEKRKIKLTSGTRVSFLKSIYPSFSYVCVFNRPFPNHLVPLCRNQSSRL